MRKIYLLLALLCAMVQGAWAQTDALKGKFTINAGGGQVKFSPGNLRATTTDNGTNWTWSFAAHQWDYVGTSSANGKINGNGTVSESGTVDLFCWVGSDSNKTGAAQYGITWSDEYDDLGYSDGLKSDWGNTIGEGYRTLTNAEWNYLLNSRASGSIVNGTKNARYAQATVNDVNGLILFPDGVTIASNEASAWGPINVSNAWYTKCNASQWTALEAKGCVFLPAAGCRYVAYDNTLHQYYMKVSSTGERGFYWSKTDYSPKAYSLTVMPNDIHMEQWTSRFQGCSVRLVKDFVQTYEGSCTLTDANAYTETEDRGVTTATYTKTFDADRVDKYQAWLVPFDYTITAADLQNFTFYKINMIANAGQPGVNAASDALYIFLNPMAVGDVLHANMPYVYKPLVATDYAFTSNNIVVKSKNTGVVAQTETMEDTYKFYGTYDETSPTAQDPFYYVNIDGSVSLGNSNTVTVGAYRWIIRVESKFGNTPAYARVMYFFDDEDTTGIISTTNFTNSGAWYDMQGRKLDGKPTKKGLYIVNGRKVVVQ